MVLHSRAVRRRDALNTFAAWLIACFGLLTGAGNAAASEALARQHGCLACHAIDKKVVGPSFRDIAAKYKGDAGAEAKLMEKLQKGGAGIWGAILMPPMRTVPEGDLRNLIKWILSAQ